MEEKKKVKYWEISGGLSPLPFLNVRYGEKYETSLTTSTISDVSSCIVSFSQNSDINGTILLKGNP